MKQNVIKKKEQYKKFKVEKRFKMVKFLNL